MIFNAITLFGGLAMFLYGMRMMSGGLKSSASGTLKNIMEKVTNSPINAFLLGVAVTAIIQSSTATIVITSGLVAAGIISLRQSLGIIIGANVGTTVTGQIIRLLDIDGSAGSVLQFFKPSTLAPIALIIGIVLIMFCKFKRSDTLGTIAMGFGILFSGLMNMTGAVSSITDTPLMQSLFTGLGNNHVVGYLTGAGVAFVLQSSSATVGILQAFSVSGDLTFKAIYAVITGIYLGDCVTTAIVCSIGAKADQKRVGIVNILFNLSETVLVLVVVNVLHAMGFLDKIWDMPVNSGVIANTNTVFNLTCAILLLPMVGVYEKLSKKIIKDEPEAVDKYAEKFDALNPVFFSTPALALRSCYDLLRESLSVSIHSINKALGMIEKYDPELYKEVEEEEDLVDELTDRVSDYMVQLSPYIKEDYHVKILDEYYKVVTEFERLSDHALNLAMCARNLEEDKISFSDPSLKELEVVRDLLNKIFNHTTSAFEKRDVAAARHIEPLEEVMDDMIHALNDNHLARLRCGTCTIHAGTVFLDILTNIERISDVCSNIGIAVIARVNPEVANLAHSYISSLHKGNDANYNREYEAAHEEFFDRLNNNK
ncbi:MAG: Na/Pi cotransporter family protein [Lachnospiraceae bacterium]|nr:Na/Pi cotransporter family protein [Lachnospiraceae bacterium]